MIEKSKATTKPWFSHLLRHPARKQSGSVLGDKTHKYQIFGQMVGNDSIDGYNYVDEMSESSLNSAKDTTSEPRRFNTFLRHVFFWGGEFYRQNCYQSWGE